MKRLYLYLIFVAFSLQAFAEETTPLKEAYFDLSLQEKYPYDKLLDFWITSFGGEKEAVIEVNTGEEGSVKPVTVFTYGEADVSIYSDIEFDTADAGLVPPATITECNEADEEYEGQCEEEALLVNVENNSSSSSSNKAMAFHRYKISPTNLSTIHKRYASLNLFLSKYMYRSSSSWNEKQIGLMASFRDSAILELFLANARFYYAAGSMEEKCDFLDISLKFRNLIESKSFSSSLLQESWKPLYSIYNAVNKSLGYEFTNRTACRVIARLSKEEVKEQINSSVSSLLIQKVTDLVESVKSAIRGLKEGFVDLIRQLEALDRTDIPTPAGDGTKHTVTSYTEVVNFELNNIDGAFKIIKDDETTFKVKSGLDELSKLDENDEYAYFKEIREMFSENSPDVEPKELRESKAKIGQFRDRTAQILANLKELGTGPDPLIPSCGKIEVETFKTIDAMDLEGDEESTRVQIRNQFIQCMDDLDNKFETLKKKSKEEGRRNIFAKHLSQLVCRLKLGQDCEDN